MFLQEIDTVPLPVSMDKKVLLSKFQGAISAALVGDCIGATYEPMWSPVSLNTLKCLDMTLQSKGWLDYFMKSYYAM